MKKQFSATLGILVLMCSTVTQVTADGQFSMTPALKNLNLQLRETATERIYPARDKAGEIFERVCTKDPNTGKCTEYFLRKTCTAPTGGGSCNAVLVWRGKTAGCHAEKGASCTAHIALTADEWQQLALPL